MNFWDSMTHAGFRWKVEGQLAFENTRDFVGASRSDLDSIWCGDFVNERSGVVGKMNGTAGISSKRGRFVIVIVVVIVIVGEGGETIGSKVTVKS